MELIKRYVYAVTKSFNDKERDEIEKELMTNIEDMIEQQQGEESYEEKVKNVLLELGDPEILADEYRSSKRYLIGPKYYNTYILVLKIVSLSVFGGISIAVFVGAFFSPTIDIGKVVSGYFSAVFSAVLQAFAWTTIGFMIAERKDTKSGKEKLEKSIWDPSKLPNIPEKDAMIPLSKSVFNIIFTTLFYTIFITIVYSAPTLIGVYIKSGGFTVSVPIFNGPVLQSYTILFLAVFIISIFKELLKIYYKRWTLKLSILLVGLIAASLVLVLIVFTNTDIWNPNFASEIITQMNLDSGFYNLWAKIKGWFLAIIVIASLFEAGEALYKGYRHRG